MSYVVDLVKELGPRAASRLSEAFVRLPFAIAQSVQLMRLVTLIGFSLLSIILVAFTVHVSTVQEAIRATEEEARRSSLNCELLLREASTVASIFETMLRGEHDLAARLRAGEPVLPSTVAASPSLSKLGLAVLVDGEAFPLQAALDDSVSKPEWHRQRWLHLSTSIAGELISKDAVTLFLGLEREYRGEEDFAHGARLSGSLVVARAWKDPTLDWVSVVVLLPAESFLPYLRLGADDYSSGDYDYLVDGDGFVLAHPRYQLINGTDADGRSLRAASNAQEVGKLPLNTRDSDWIAGDDILNEAFNSMMRGEAVSVVYKNLQQKNRLTSFRRLDLAEKGIDGMSLGVVAGRGLTWLEALTAPLLLESPESLTRVLQILSSAYLVLLSGWLLLVTRIRSLHQDLLAWNRYLSPDYAHRLKLLPIANEPTEAHILPDTIGIVISIDIPDLHRVAAIEGVLDSFGQMAIRLRQDGWIVSHWSLRSIFAARPLVEAAGEDEPSKVWSPVAVAEYFKRLSYFRPMLQNRYRISYGIGDLRIHAARVGPMRRAVISIYGSSLTNALRVEHAASQEHEGSWRALVFACHEAEAANLHLAGQMFAHDERLYGLLALGEPGLERVA